MRLFRRKRASPEVRKPIFIVGCGRSGTTLLFQLLREHPEVRPTTGYPDGEDHVGWNEHGRAMIGGFGFAASDRDQTGHSYCLHRDERDVDPSVADDMRRYYFEDVLRGDATLRVLNKCPHLSNKLRYVRGIFPDALFIHIVRDCAPVVASWKVTLDRDHVKRIVYWPETPFPCLWILPAPEGADRGEVFRREERAYPGGGLMRFVDYWVATNSNVGVQLRDASDQLHVVRYEDLCADPSKTIARIYDFCGLSALSVTAGPQVDTRRNLGFHEVLSREQIRSIEAEAAAVRAKFGYA